MSADNPYADKGGYMGSGKDIAGNPVQQPGQLGNNPSTLERIQKTTEIMRQNNNIRQGLNPDGTPSGGGGAAVMFNSAPAGRETAQDLMNQAGMNSGQAGRHFRNYSQLANDMNNSADNLALNRDKMNAEIGMNTANNQNKLDQMRLGKGFQWDAQKNKNKTLGNPMGTGTGYAWS